MIADIPGPRLGGVARSACVGAAFVSSMAANARRMPMSATRLPLPATRRLKMRVSPARTRSITSHAVNIISKAWVHALGVRELGGRTPEYPMERAY